MICKNCHCNVPDGRFCLFCGWDQNQTPAECTLEKIHDRWIRCKHYRQLTPAGKSGYDLAWRRQLKSLADRKINQISLAEYQAILDSMADNGLSQSTQAKVQQLISQLSQMAISEGIITRNPAGDLILEGRSSRETLPFEDHHIATLLQYVKDPDAAYQQAAKITLTLIFTGYRPEELFSIRRCNVNPQEGFLIAGSKTEAGKNRIVPVVDIIAPFLTEWYLSCPPDPDAYLIRGPRGGKIVLNNWRAREFYPMTQELGINRPDQIAAKRKIPHITPYSARHTFATLAWRADVDSNALTKMIGHASIKTTAKHYIHRDYMKMRTEADKISAFWLSEHAV